MEVEVIEKSDNELKFRVKGGSQSVLNVLRDIAVSMDDVSFAGFKLEHPLEASSTFILKTKSKNVSKVFKEIIDESRKKLKDIKSDFDHELK